MPRTVRTIVELLALAVGLVGGYLYLEELGRVGLFWFLAFGIVGCVVVWHARRRLKRWARRIIR